MIQRESRFLKVVLWSPYVPYGTHMIRGVCIKKCKRYPNEVDSISSVLSWIPPPLSTEVSSPYHRAHSMGNTHYGCSLEPSRHLPFLGFLPKHRLSSKSCNRRLELLSLLPEVTLQIRVGWLSPADQYTQLSMAMSKGLRGYIFSLGNNLLGRLFIHHRIGNISDLNRFLLFFFPWDI